MGPGDDSAAGYNGGVDSGWNGSSMVDARMERGLQATLALHRRGQWRQAERRYRRLVERFPRAAEPWHCWGILQFQTGRVDAALQRLAHAALLAPEAPRLAVEHARVLVDLGRLAEAEARLAPALARDPAAVGLLLEYTGLLLRQFRGDEVAARLQPVLRPRPEHGMLWLQFGRAQEQTGYREEAVEAYRQACRFTPGAVEPRIQLAAVLRREGRFAESGRALDEALSLDSRNTMALLGMANLAADRGDFAALERLCRQILEINPREYEAWQLLLECRRPSDRADPLLQELERAAAAVGSAPNAAALFFALGRAREAVGEIDAAFTAYARANRTRRGELNYEPSRQLAYLHELGQTLDEAFIARTPQVGLRAADLAVRPIFVLGIPRSGTTLVESLLAAHPEVTAGGEMHYIHNRFKQLIGVRNLEHTGRWLQARDDTALNALARAWAEHLNRKARGRTWITDKLPDNFAYVGLLRVLFPEAPIVHVHRDPLDNCFSLYTLSFSGGMEYSYNLEELGRYYRGYRALMAHWNRVLPERLIEIGYEALVARPDTEVRRLVTACGLTWNPACLDFHHCPREVSTASRYAVRQPVYTASAGRARRFERHLGVLRQALTQ